MLFAPAQDRIRGELGAVIGDDHSRLAAPLDDCDELAGNPSARDRGVGNRRQAFSRHVIDDVENTEAPAAGELIVDKVERPARIWLGLDQNGRPVAHRLAATSAFAHGQSLLAIEPVDAVEPGWLALVPQQDEEPPIANRRRCWQDRADGRVARYRTADVGDSGSSCDRRQRSYRPAARSSPARHANERQPLAWRLAFLPKDTDGSFADCTIEPH